MGEWEDRTKAFEGLASRPYKDSRGVPTVGYGFNLDTYPDLSRNMSKNEADEYFVSIYSEAEKRAKRFVGPVWGDLSPNQQGIMTDMSYNLGNRLFNFKKMQEAVQDYDVEGVKREMKDSKWYKQTGDRSKSHVRNWDWQPNIPWT